MNIELLAQNPYITLGSFALAILGVLSAFIFYFRSQRNKTPCYDYSSSTIVDGLSHTMEGFEVRYKDEVQNRVTVTKLIFWNAGRETIDKSDLVERDRLRIVCPNDFSILNMLIIEVSTDSIAVEIGDIAQENNLNYAYLDFDFLDHEDYFMIQIIHNGDSSADFWIDGKIKGVKEVEIGENTRFSKVKAEKLNKALIAMADYWFGPFYTKYVLSFIFGVVGIFFIWLLFEGKTNWYVWLGAAFWLYMSVASPFYTHKIPPVKIKKKPRRS